MAVPEQTQEQSPDQTLPVSRSARWLEMLLVTGLCFGLGAWNRPEDPFYLAASFPWPVIAPLLVGLRYGFFMALVSALLILAGLGAYLRLQGTVGDFPYVWTIGLLAVSLLAGEFRDFWDRQREKLQASNTYYNQRLEEFTRNYYLLKVSHDRLEQQLAGSSNSLREALRRLYGDLAKAEGRDLDRNRAQAMLQVLVRYGQLQVAGLHAVKQGRVEPEPLATVGRYQTVSPSDPLLLHAFEERTMVSIQSEYRQRHETLNTDLLAAIPLIDSEGRLMAFCLVEAMPFFSFESRSLRFLAILAGHMADMISEQAQTPAHETAQWRTLRRHIARVGVDASEHGLPGAVLAIRVPEASSARTLSDQIRRIRRGLDIIAEHHGEYGCLLVVLMPLTDELGAQGYLQRLEDQLRQQLGMSLRDLQAEVRNLQIDHPGQALAWLDEMQALTGVPEAGVPS
ncbi:MAG: PelD GGDEF domain-containing protein [Marinobacter sp.]|uniref:PelD GGDEF domain-containing protein n=1 Tax=Marinobacter sp. TaxID=50741 RepID=UPI00299EE870|nr:PelD GGDEF domain-containing protein [Marinobacter sp.]MDX1635065.1 PelD GGDEF domain-containing protein [Marinobacter sp.]